MGKFTIKEENIVKEHKAKVTETLWQTIKSNLKKIGIVDYAHSPDSLKNVLTTINDIKKSKNILVTVIGCGGDRDKTKRPIMGKIATSLSDKVIFTSDNPRNEDPLEIINQMLEGEIGRAHV